MEGTYEGQQIPNYIVIRNKINAEWNDRAKSIMYLSTLSSQTNAEWEDRVKSSKYTNYIII